MAASPPSAAIAPIFPVPSSPTLWTPTNSSSGPTSTASTPPIPTNAPKRACVIAELMQKARFGAFVGIGGVDAVDVGPDDEFVGVHDVGDYGTGKIRAIAAEGGDAAVRSCADETGNNGDDAGLEERKKNVAAALLGLFEMRLGVTKSIASQDELGGRDGHRGDAGLFESSGKEPSAKTFAKRGQAIEEIRASGDGGVGGNFMK